MKNWQWKPGMLALLDGFRFARLVRLCGNGDWHSVVHTAGRYLPVPLTPNDVPDLKDAATVGAAIALARELWGSPALYVYPAVTGANTVKGWICYTNLRGNPDNPQFYADTEGAAVLAAIEAAPSREAP